MKLDVLNHLSSKEAQEEFLKCCGSKRWAEAMTQSRPFKNPAELFDKAQRTWYYLTPEDWVEAFSQHPKIGDLDSLRIKFGATKIWAKKEQSGVALASEKVLTELAEGNQLYEKKFGYIFIVCATGKNAEEMLSVLKQRLQNDPETEMRIAADEQNKITRLRLERVLK
ncbi:MAG: 2-oxo-4-hydroxy-4-carboxy-5-ureidoimidazoline decarboxylase [Elusimicrobia bacterium]|nr:2-oxo-4-hydroxy-4-carboxy-5-ureidoimidazoline decarboxylase [Elusimicrobiota bacterium]